MNIYCFQSDYYFFWIYFFQRNSSRVINHPKNDDIIIQWSANDIALKTQYQSLLCNSCGTIPFSEASNIRPQAPFIIDKKLSINTSADFAYTRDGGFVVSDKFISIIERFKINGCTTVALGNTGWNLMIITKIMKVKENVFENYFYDCGHQASSSGCIEFKEQIEVPDSDTAFFSVTPRSTRVDYGSEEMGYQDIFITEKAAKILSDNGIKGPPLRCIKSINKNSEKIVNIKLDGRSNSKSEILSFPVLSKTKIKKSKKKLATNEIEISEFEKSIDYSLEFSYRNFLLLHNGGIPSPNRYGDDEYEIDHFYSVQELPQAWEEFQVELKEAMGGTLPEDTLLPIAPDTSGNTFCLAIAGPNTGRIALFDHEENDYNFIEDSFTAFFNSLKKASVEEE